jgi:hypothetical protein
LVLKHSNFTFNGEHFLQINGTAMGTKMAPSCANIFMWKLEKLIIQSVFQMTFQFSNPFFGGVFVGADAFDSESLAVRNTFGAMFRMTTLWGQVLMFICQKYSVQPSSPNQTHLLQRTHHQKTDWRTEMSSEKEGLQQCEH